MYNYPPYQAPRTGVRLSTTCTTGWFDWFHGELWLFPDGLLRIPIGWVKTLCFVGYAAEARNPVERSFSAEEFASLISNPRNRWIPRAAIRNAHLRYGSTHVLQVEMWDGSRRQLLTLPRKSTYLALQSALQAWLGPSFIAE